MVCVLSAGATTVMTLAKSRDEAIITACGLLDQKINVQEIGPLLGRRDPGDIIDSVEIRQLHAIRIHADSVTLSQHFVLLRRNGCRNTCRRPKGCRAAGAVGGAGVHHLDGVTGRRRSVVMGVVVPQSDGVAKRIVWKAKVAASPRS